MIKIVLSDTNVFKHSIEAISNIVEEIDLTVDPEGISVKSMDKSHIAMIQFMVDEYFFNVYEVDIGTQLHLDVGELNKCFKRCKSDDTLTITTSDGKLVLTFEGITKREYRVKLIDLEYNSRDLPDLEGNTVEIPCDVLKESVGDIYTVSEKVSLGLDEDVLTFDAPGSFIEAHSEYIHACAEVEGRSSGTYSLEYVKKMLNACKISEEMTLLFGESTPLELSFPFPDGNGKLCFILAPIIEDDS